MAERGTVTLEEMTRRRDRWRAEAARLSRELADEKLTTDRLAKAVITAERERRDHWREAGNARRAQGGAEAQANALALEVGRLKTELEDLQLTLAMVLKGSRYEGGLQPPPPGPDGYEDLGALVPFVRGGRIGPPSPTENGGQR